MRKPWCKFVIAGVVAAGVSSAAFAEDQNISAPGTEPQVIFQTSVSDGAKSNRKEYYFKKILDTEIAFLKEKVAQMERDNRAALDKQQDKYEKLLEEQKEAFAIKMQESPASRVQALEKELEASRAEQAAQKKDFEDTLSRKQTEYNIKIKALDEKIELLEKEKKSAGAQPEQLQPLRDEIGALNNKLEQQEKTYKQLIAKSEEESVKQLELLRKEQEAYRAEMADKQKADVKKDLREKDEQIRELKQQAERVNAEIEKQKKESDEIINNLKEQQKKQEMSMLREQETPDVVILLEKREKEIAALKEKTDQLSAELSKQEATYGKILEQKDKDIADRENKLREEYKQSALEKEKNYEGQLIDKYRKIDEALREKDKSYAQQLLEKDQEIAKLTALSAEKEKTLRQLAAEKELEYERKLSQLSASFEDEREILKKSSEQMRLYLVKLKEELKTKMLVLEEKDNTIGQLNKKLSGYSGGGQPQEEAADIYGQERESLKQENKLLQEQIKELRRENTEQKTSFENKLAKQKKDLMRLEQNSQMQHVGTNAEWDKKLKITEEKYIKQLRELEEKNLREKQEFELKFNEVSEKLREKAREEAQLKNKLDDFRANQVGLLEEMLFSKATIMQKLPQNFSGEDKGRAQIYFDRGISAILNKNYARAKYELEQVLLIDANHQMTISILSSLDFLLGRK